MSRSLWTSLRPEIITLTRNIKLVRIFFGNILLRRDGTWNLAQTPTLCLVIFRIFARCFRNSFISSQLDFCTKINKEPVHHLPIHISGLLSSIRGQTKDKKSNNLFIAHNARPTNRYYLIEKTYWQESSTDVMVGKNQASVL